MTDVLVTGAGGFIGGHLVAALRERGVQSIRGVDRVPVDQWHQRFDDVDNRCADLQDLSSCLSACEGVQTRLQPRRRHGRHGLHREQQGAVHALGPHQHAHARGRPRQPASSGFFYSSSACVYAAGQAGVTRRRRRCARRTPTRPCPRTATAGRSSSASGCAGTSTRTSGSRLAWPATTMSTARYGTYDGGREKAPAAICRKVASGQAQRQRTRSRSGATASRRAASCTSTTASTARCGSRRATCDEPLNIGSDELVTINQLVDIVEEIAGVTLKRKYNLDAPQGVRGRNSDNTLIQERLGWEPRHLPRVRPREHLPLDLRPDELGSRTHHPLSPSTRGGEWPSCRSGDLHLWRAGPPPRRRAWTYCIARSARMLPWRSVNSSAHRPRQARCESCWPSSRALGIPTSAMHEARWGSPSGRLEASSPATKRRLSSASCRTQSPTAASPLTAPAWRQSAQNQMLSRLPSEDLASELRRRGWTATEP